jgi:hypothetical protein
MKHPNAVPIIEDDEQEPDELDMLLQEVTAASAEDKRLKAARKRLAEISDSKHPAAAGEQAALISAIRKLEEGRIWITTARLALFHTQICDTCGADHSFFQGWMNEQKHVSDRTARRLIPWREGDTPMVERREDHFQGHMDTCHECVESVIAINIATGLAPEGK